MTAQRAGLVGCVKSKRGVRTTARDLYVSPLFLRRRSAVEQTCGRWFILSALHGLVQPDDELDPYDDTLRKKSVSERRAWSEALVEELERRLGLLGRYEFELHAGRDYIEHGVHQRLVASGAAVLLPVAGMGIGRQLAYYGTPSAPLLSGGPT
jgi:hypothetical protein